MSWDKEFGRYLDFRKILQDTSANIIERRNDFIALAISTDFVFTKRKGTVGLKFSLVNSLRNIRGFDEDGMPMQLKSGYFSNTIHYQHEKLTGSIQWNIGTYAAMFMIGAAYKL